MNVVRIKTQIHLLKDSIHTNLEGLSGGNTSGDQGSAWSRGNGGWDDDDE